ncbi:MAG: peptidoglycan-binding domain-containing protein [Streptosporangiaceae bacterium]
MTNPGTGPVNPTYIWFVDVTTANASRIPLVSGGLRAYYGTGAGIAETAAQVAAAKAAGMGIAMYDQTPALLDFASGEFPMADIELYAGTAAAAHNGVAARQARGQQSLLYVSQGNWSALKAALSSPQGVSYGIANWSLSQTAAEAFLAASPDVAFVQYGNLASNPLTLVPGTSMDLTTAQADINVAKYNWAGQFLAGAVVPPPALPPALHPSGLPVYANGSRTLQFLEGRPAAVWMRGTDVLFLQTFIGAPAPGQPPLEKDGVYGPLTGEAVSWYEGMRKIMQEKPYGVAGPEVWHNILG